MVHRRSRWATSPASVLVCLLLLSHAQPSHSAEPPGILQFDKTLKWDQKKAVLFAFAPDGKVVAGCGWDWMDGHSTPCLLRLWDVGTGEKTLDLNLPDSKIISMVFSHDGHSLFSGSWDGTVRTHDLRSLKTQVIPDVGGQEVHISPDGARLASSAGQVAYLVDIASKKITATKTLAGATDIGLPMAFSPDGKVIAIARQDRGHVPVYEIELCDAGNLESKAVLRGDCPPVAMMSFSPDGSLLATLGPQGAVVIWDVKATKQRPKTPTLPDLDPKGITGVLFSPDGKLLGIGGVGGVVLLEVDTLKVLDKIKGPGVFFTLAFSPDGRVLLTNSSDLGMHRHETKLWKVWEKGGTPMKISP
jgi:WD40 repeat protein